MFGRDGKKRLARVAALAALAFAALGMQAAEGRATPSRLCQQLETELALLPDDSETNEYGIAAETQRDQIDLARERAAELGCGRAITGAMIAQCASLNAKIDEMLSNLEDLEGQLDPRQARRTERQRARLLDAIEANECRTEAAVDEERGDDLFDELIPNAIGSAETPDENSATVRYPKRIVVGRNAQQPGGGEYRTLCVRTCDGYFYPMSNAASLSDFERDQKSCEASCPGADVELFYHRAQGEAQEDMVSARSGAPYRDLPTAYDYKRLDASQTQQCGCTAGGQNRSFSIIAGDGKPIKDPAGDQTVIAEQPGPAPAAVPPDPNRKVRVVGPIFLPDPQEATDLRVPGPTPAP